MFWGGAALATCVAVDEAAVGVVVAVEAGAVIHLQAQFALSADVSHVLCHTGRRPGTTRNFDYDFGRTMNGQRDLHPPGRRHDRRTPRIRPDVEQVLLPKT